MTIPLLFVFGFICMGLFISWPIFREIWIEKFYKVALIMDTDDGYARLKGRLYADNLDENHFYIEDVSGKIYFDSKHFPIERLKAIEKGTTIIAAGYITVIEGEKVLTKKGDLPFFIRTKNVEQSDKITLEKFFVLMLWVVFILSILLFILINEIPYLHAFLVNGMTHYVPKIWSLLLTDYGVFPHIIGPLLLVLVSVLASNALLKRVLLLKYFVFIYKWTFFSSLLAVLMQSMFVAMIGLSMSVMWLSLLISLMINALIWTVYSFSAFDSLR